MSALNNLKLVVAVKINAMSPVQFRRNKLVAKITDQINLAQAMREGREYVATRVRTIKDRVSGETQSIEQSRKVRHGGFALKEERLAFSSSTAARFSTSRRARTPSRWRAKRILCQRSKR